MTTNRFNRPLLVALHNLPDFENKVQTTSFPEIKKIYGQKKPVGKSAIKEMVPGSGALLKHFALNPLSPLTKAIAQCKLNRQSGISADDHLTENGYTKKEQVRLFKGRGRQPVLHQLTDKGKQFLNIHHPEVKIETFPGKGSLEHRVHQHLVKERFRRQGFDVQIEKHDSDIVAKRPNEDFFITIEIANENSRNLQQRIQANTQAGAKRTLIICSSRKFFQKAKKQFPFFSQVEVEDMEMYLLERTAR